MSYDYSRKVQWLLGQWNRDHGVLYRLQYGDIDWAKAEAFLSELETWVNEIPPEEPLDPALVGMLWIIPDHIDRNRHRLEARGESHERVVDFRERVFGVLTKILGM